VEGPSELSASQAETPNGQGTMHKHSLRQLAAVTAAVATLSGCAGGNMGALGDILGGAMGGQQQGQGQNGQVLAEIQSIDSNRQIISLRTQDGQTGNVMFDQNTVVVYQQQQYPVTALERGDVGYFQLQQNGQNGTYAARVEVTQSVQERNGQTSSGNGTYGSGSGSGSGSGTYGSSQRMELSGTVGAIDYNQGWFELRTQQGTARVTLPYGVGDATTDYFRRLRTGMNVRIEGTNLGSGRIELYRFM
jgi:hypothetical protein